MKEIFIMGIALLVVDLLVVSFKSYYAKNYWKTKKIRELVYAGVIKKSQHNPDFVESKTFRKKFQKAFSHYSVNMIADGGKLGSDEVENYLLDLVVNDILLKVTPPI